MIFQVLFPRMYPEISPRHAGSFFRNAGTDRTLDITLKKKK